MAQIFISHALVDQWLGAGRVELADDLMKLGPPGQETSMFVNPAVFFERVDGTEGDPYELVGTVKSSVELAQLGAEHYDTSVVLGDYAYTVKPGFVAIPVGPDGAEAELDGATWGVLLARFGQLAPGLV